MPTSTFDVNAAYAPIAARLAQVDGVKAVRGVNDLTQILRGQTTGTDGYVYLYFDGVAPVEDAGNGRHQKVRVTYTVVIASQDYNRDGMPRGVGKLIGSVMQALAGFAPLDADERSRTRLKPANGGQPVHAYGHSLYPLKYTLDLIYVSTHAP